MEYKPVQLYFEETGQGVPVILLHGFPLDHTTWDRITPSLKEKARLILPDLRGHGRSPATEGVYSMRLLAEDIAALMDKLQIEKAVLVGHSMGGYISLAFAHAYPHRLAGLGLVATIATADLPEKRQARLITVDEVKRKGVQTMAKSQAARLSDRDDVREHIYNLVMQTKPSTIISCLKGMAERPDASPYLPEINVPAVVIAGKADKGIPIEESRVMAQLLPKAWIVESDSGHMPMLEDTQNTIQALCQLIELAGN